MRDSMLRAVIASPVGLPLRMAALGFALVVALALPTNPALAAPCAGFTDVEDSSIFCGNVAWLKNRAITLGCTSATTFCPVDAVSRLAMAAFMNRLGTALTPVQLAVDAASGAIDLDANPVVCQSADFEAEGFARMAFADLRFSGTASAAVGLAAELVMSTNAGASWTALNLFASRGFVAANQWGTLTDLGFNNLDADQSARWGVRLSRGGLPGGADLIDSRCQLRVRIGPAPVNLAPVVNAGANQTITLPASASLVGTLSDDGLPNPPGTTTVAWSTLSGLGTVTFGNASAAVTTASFSTAGVYVLRLTVSDSALTITSDVTIIVNAATSLPPNPASVAPAVDPTVATNVFAATAFLYSGANPIQTGVSPGTIQAQRAAVLRGKVQGRDGSVLTGVAIGIHAHPEFGQTLSRADGAFDLAVNGGGPLTVNYQKAGFLPVQRQISVPSHGFALLPDVVMTPLDAQVTTIALNAAAMQVARGSSTTDADGTRRATLLVPQGTTANLLLQSGTTQPIAALNVRATEYTVGGNGPNAMPAVLPPTSGYTYAVELSADEAIAADATSVVFNQPIFSYVENFLRFPVGMAVPTGFYDRTKAAWIASANGRVIKITAIAAGLASVDSVGTGALPPLVLSDAERQQLALLYGVGQELWRVPVNHFTPWDFNWPFGPPSDAAAPQVPSPPSDDQLDEPTCSAGSVIECENQTLGESLRLVGTPFTLNYRSARSPGRSDAHTLRIPLSGASVPASLKRIDLDVQVAGRSFRQSFAAGPNQQGLLTWDRKDAYGRVLQGAQPVKIDIGYVYDAVYRTPADFAASFGFAGTVALTGNRTRNEVTLSQSQQTAIGPLDARVFSLGGWSLDRHHVYDPQRRVLHLGNGQRRGSDSIGAVIQDVRNPDGTQVARNEHSVAVGPDGSVYVAGGSAPGGNPVRRMLPGQPMLPFGSVERVNTLYDIAVGPDGSLYVVQHFVNSERGNRISRIAVDGTTTIVAGRDDAIGFSGDGGPALLATLSRPQDVAVGADGTLYIVDNDNNRIRRIGPDGIITTVVGSGAVCPIVARPCGDGGPATLARLDQPMSVAAAPDGSLYFFEFGSRRIRRVGPDGIITTFAGTGAACGEPNAPMPCGDGGPATQASLDTGGSSRLALGPDGTLYIAEHGGNRVRAIGSDGIIRTVAGRGDFLAVPFVDGMPASQAQLFLNNASAADVAIAPDGVVYIAAGSRLRRVLQPLPALATTDFAVASEAGGQLYVFDSNGRHLRTLQAMTGAIIREFAYDANGRLMKVTEKTGSTDNVTAIERDAAGNPTAIVAPFGQRTTLGTDANGFLASITNPAGEQVQLASTPEGLLTSLTDPRGKTSTFAYDAQGRLVRDSDPAGGSQALARTATQGQFTVARATALSRTTTYKVEDLPGGTQKRTTTAPDGTQALSEENVDAGTRKLTTAEGTVTKLERGPDARFGMQAPIVKSLSVVLPGGPTLTASSTQTAVLSNPSDILSMTSLTETSTVDGRTTTNTYTAATRTEVTTTPAGRSSTVTIDTLGRPVQMQAGGLASAALTYDARGRLATVTRGSGVGARTFVFSYNSAGFLASITDPIGRTAQFTHDAAGRVISKTLPDGRVVGIGYDAAGNVTTLTPPGRPAHTFAFSDRNELTLATPPAVAGTGASSFSYNVDRQHVTTARPDNRSVAIGYDSAGRPIARTFATGGVTTGFDTLSYDSAGRVVSVAAASGVTTSYAYAGSLLTGESWFGSTAGSVTRAYDTSFRLASQSVNGANAIAFSYDSDSLITSAGALAITRDPQHGLATGTTMGVVATTTGYNGFGETTSYAASASGNPLYDVTYVHDGIGRISQKTETLGGVADTYVYTYDAAGQVTLVTKNGAAVESYGYDSNGNRVTATVAGSSVTASYDAQDRLTNYGTTSFAYTAAGELLSRTAGAQTTTYQYDAIGNLVSVTLPSGTAITYVVDGRSRRVGKRVNGTPVQGFLYSDALRPVAELDGAGALVSRFVYAGHHAPSYVIKGGVAHRIVTDRLGSVRLVVNSNTGAIVQRMDYDTFGNVVLDTNPGFQPFGFAGGMYEVQTGLVRFGARDYDPQVGRWTAKDRTGFSGGDANLYRYVRNNPVNLVDRFGKSAQEIEDEIEFLEEALGNMERRIRPSIQTDLPTEVLVDRKTAQLIGGYERRLSQLKAIKKLFGPGANAFVFVIGCVGISERAEAAGRTTIEQIDVEGQRDFVETIHFYADPFVETVVNIVRDILPF